MKIMTMKKYIAFTALALAAFINAEAQSFSGSTGSITFQRLLLQLTSMEAQRDQLEENITFHESCQTQGKVYTNVVTVGATVYGCANIDLNVTTTEGTSEEVDVLTDGSYLYQMPYSALYEGGFLGQDIMNDRVFDNTRDANGILDYSFTDYNGQVHSFKKIIEPMYLFPSSADAEQANMMNIYDTIITDEFRAFVGYEKDDNGVYRSYFLMNCIKPECDASAVTLNKFKFYRDVPNITPQL